MDRTIAWVLNFDADEELAHPGAYAPSPSVLARVEPLIARVGLVRPGDVVLPERGAPGAFDAGSAIGRAWCPTPRALRRFAGAGVRAPAAPSIDVLRSVNDRRFAATLGGALPGARIATSVDDVARAVADRSPRGQWVLRTPHGFAGRGRRIVSAGALDEATLRWIAASLRRFGALDVAPWVERRGDYGLHGFVTRTGRAHLGTPTVQICDERGTWRRSERAPDDALAETERRLLFDAADEAADALVRAGYWGPFGIDAFRWVDETMTVQFCPRCEVNARYTMGWATGMGDVRPDLDPSADAGG